MNQNNIIECNALKFIDEQNIVYITPEFVEIPVLKDKIVQWRTAKQLFEDNFAQTLIVEELDGSPIKITLLDYLLNQKLAWDKTKEFTMIGNITFKTSQTN